MCDSVISNTYQLHTPNSSLSLILLWITYILYREGYDQQQLRVPGPFILISVREAPNQLLEGDLGKTLHWKNGSHAITVYHDHIWKILELF